MNTLNHPGSSQEVPPKLSTQGIPEGYAHLEDVLLRALQQAALGKGAERHANALPFHHQPMQTISSLLGTHEGLLFQAMKKVQESARMDRDAAVRELLGAINYIAGAIIYLEAKRG